MKENRVLELIRTLREKTITVNIRHRIKSLIITEKLKTQMLQQDEVYPLEEPGFSKVE